MKHHRMTEGELVIDQEDMCSIARLLAQTACCLGGHQQKKRVLVDGLCGLVDANSWLWGATHRAEACGRDVHLSYLRGGFENFQFVSLLRGLSDPIVQAARGRLFSRLAESLQHTTMSRPQMDPDGQVMKTQAAERLLDAGVGVLIFSVFPLSVRAMSSVALYRRLGDEPFTEREKSIVHFVLGEVGGLHSSGWFEEKDINLFGLSPRLHVILNLLLDGQGRKQIAYYLQIKENTVAGYIKEIYRRFSVNSQPQLMKCFASGLSLTHTGPSPMEGRAKPKSDAFGGLAS